MLDTRLIKRALKGLCPQCEKGALFRPGLLTLTLNEKCPSCGLNLQKNDSADGPAVFLIFILGFALVPLALWLDAAFTLSLWFHATLWTLVALGLTLGTLKPLKAYIIALQYKHRPGDWK